MLYQTRVHFHVYWFPLITCLVSVILSPQGPPFWGTIKSKTLQMASRIPWLNHHFLIRSFQRKETLFLLEGMVLKESWTWCYLIGEAVFFCLSMKSCCYVSGRVRGQSQASLLRNFDSLNLVGVPASSDLYPKKEERQFFRVALQCSMPIWKTLSARCERVTHLSTPKNFLASPYGWELKSLAYSVFIGFFICNPRPVWSRSAQGKGKGWWQVRR